MSESAPTHKELQTEIRKVGLKVDAANAKLDQILARLASPGSPFPTALRATQTKKKP